LIFIIEIIYQFRVTIKDSLIDGAGKGAFLKFMGAKELPPFRKRGAKYLEQDRWFRSPNTPLTPLVAAHPGGYFVTVKIDGENLQFHNYTGRVLPQTLVAAVPRPELELTQFLKIHFANPEDPYLERELDDMKDSSGGTGRVGLFGIHSVDDYVTATDRTFTTYGDTWELVQLALYGPFLPSDRKEYNHYELKTFIFSNEPGEWGFEIDQKRPDGRIQIADITDDKTGMPHSVARENIAMYINETADDDTLLQTVTPWNHLETGQLFYYFDHRGEMKRGQEIELLVSYEDFYDEVRERKGYGKRIKNGEVLSDAHFPTFLCRSFDERDKMHEMFDDLDEPIYLDELFDECKTRYWGHLLEVVNDYLCVLCTTTHESKQLPRLPYAQQVVAFRRLEWLVSLFVKTYDRLHCESNMCNANPKMLRWSWWSKLLSLIDGCNQNMIDSNGIDVAGRLRKELIEEHCYSLRRRLRYPYAEGLWCDVANELVRHFCFIVTRHGEESNATLFSHLASKALEASHDIPRIGLEKLSFNRQASMYFGVDICDQSQNKRMFVMSRRAKPNKTTRVLVDVGSVSASNINIDIDVTWYRSEQILFLVRIFREEFAPKSPEKDLQDLCVRMGLETEVLKTSLPLYEYSNKEWTESRSR
jgi:hypothetical protein